MLVLKTLPILTNVPSMLVVNPVIEVVPLDMMLFVTLLTDKVAVLVMLVFVAVRFIEGADKAAK